MSSVANRKFTDMKQIEFQQSGSSDINAMLTQPLLEESSTYMCEVTDLQCTIGRELAFPENAWLFTIYRIPIDPNGLYTANLHSEDLKRHIKDYTSGNDPDPTKPFWGIWEHSQQNGLQWKYGYWINTLVGHADFGNDQAIPDELYGSRSFYSSRYYSAMDFVHDVSREVKVVNDDIAANPGEFHIGMACDGGGRLEFKLSQYFRRNYLIITSDIFQKITGYNQFIGLYSSINANTPIYTINNWRDKDQTMDAAMLQQQAGITQLMATTVYNTWIQEKKFVLRIGTPLTGGLLTCRENNNNIPIQQGIDVRKKIVVEVSLPISHTLAWDGTDESTRYVLQEFIFPSETLSLGFVSAPELSQTSVKYRQKSLHGELILLNGGITLALKKLNEGQMQAFRVSLLIEYNEWDQAKKEFVLKRKPLDMEQGGFFYMKLLFTKETI